MNATLFERAKAMNKAVFRAFLELLALLVENCKTTKDAAKAIRELKKA